MLLTLLKVLFFFAVVLAAAIGLTRWQETGQTLRLEFAGSEYVLGPIQVLIALAVLLLAGWVAFKLLGLILAFLRFIAGDETALNRHFARNRQRKGFQALGEGMLAVAAGEGKVAQDRAARAAQYLDDPLVTNLLTMQAAEAAGDRDKAGAVYRTLLDDDRTRFVGVRGLMQQKLAEGDEPAALALAQKAYALKPRHAEVQNTLLDLQARQGDWKGARAVLKDKRRQGELPKDVHLRRDAVLALKEASDVLAHGNSISAREAAISANRASPDLIPAAVLAARSYTGQKDYRNASRVLEKTWSVRPHPDIAEAYAAIVPDETPAARLRRFETLIRKNPGDEESRLLKAELLLAAEDFPGARRALGDLASSHPTVRTLSIMAAVERGEGADEAVVRGWLARALTASRGPQWVCDQCQTVHDDWGPVCERCHGFDTLSWREPAPRKTTGLPAGIEMLPLLIGPATTPAPVAGRTDPAPSAQPGMTAPEPRLAAPAPTAPAPAPREVPAVPPGMIPRESDYVTVAPSITVSDEPAAPLPPAPPATPATPVATVRPNGHTPDGGGVEAAAPHPVRTAEFDIPAAPHGRAAR